MERDKKTQGFQRTILFTGIDANVKHSVFSNFNKVCNFLNETKKMRKF